MGGSDQIALANAFRKMHQSPPALLLPNAWDAVSARLFEECGFGAVATTSGGLAWALGYPDGEGAPWAEVVAATGRIVRVVDVPVSADIEAGFGVNAADVFSNVHEMIAAGVVGINIEDSDLRARGTLRTIEDAVERVRAARRAANESGVPIVLNARTDVFHHNIGEAKDRPAEAHRRARAYLEAGADCIFLFGHPELEAVTELAKSIKAPINIVGRAGMPGMAELERLGVARVSTASGPSMAALSTVRNVARALFETRQFDSLTSDVKRADLQKWFTEKLG
ncbi:MAG: isocitrate lyase/PEP mutase family protein [Xanthobacteraceae bacterium]